MLNSQQKVFIVEYNHEELQSIVEIEAIDHIEVAERLLAMQNTGKVIDTRPLESVKGAQICTVRYFYKQSTSCVDVFAIDEENAIEQLPSICATGRIAIVFDAPPTIH